MKHIETGLNGSFRVSGSFDGETAALTEGVERRSNSISVHVIAVPGLRRATVTSLVMRNDAKSSLAQKQHLR